MLGCQEVIICPDQGPAMEIYERMNYSSDSLKEYAHSYRYLKDLNWGERKKEDWKKNARHIMFSAYFQDQLNLSGDDFVEVIYDDFSDIETP